MASDEGPPPDRPRRTPAEAAGAARLDPDRLRATASGGPPRRTIDTVAGEDGDDEPEPVVRRRRRDRGSPGRARRRPPGARSIGVGGLAVLAVVLAVGGMAVVAAALLGEPDVEVASAAPPELVASTPVLSPRRTPELVARPVAVGNLTTAVDPVFAGAPADTCLQVVDGTEAVLARNDGAALIPASNLKIVTAAAALALLDPQSRLVTRVLADGRPTDGSTVEGNLYLVGGGDPLLSTDAYLEQLPNGVPPATALADLADRIAATGVRRVTGAVIGDDSRYDDLRVVEGWPQRFLTQGQVAPLSALTVDDAWTVGVGVSDDPATHAAATLTTLLDERGVSVEGAPGAGAAAPGAAPLAELPSLTIDEIVDEGLRFSDNTTMELLVKEIGLATGGEGSTASGLAAIRTWLEGTGWPLEGVVLADGSGLSEANRLTCDLLGSALAADGPEGDVADGLAVPGEPGTLLERLEQSGLEDRVRAKTGTLRPATALSGWLLTDPGAAVAFAIVTNRPGGQVTLDDVALQGDLLEAMRGYPDAPDPAQLSPRPPGPPA